MFGEEWIQRAILAGPAILFALTVHEYFHAWTALRFGDTTARDQGRLTLNPLVHLDLIGTLMFVVSNFTFGWAKPVPFNPANLRNRRFAEIWIALAGPLSNIGLAILFGLCYRLLVSGVFSPDAGWYPAVRQFLNYSVFINVVLAIFNMIPLFPLDGSHILRNLAPVEWQARIVNFERIAPWVLLALIIFGGTRYIILPAVAILVPLFRGPA